MLRSSLWQVSISKDGREVLGLKSGVTKSVMVIGWYEEDRVVLVKKRYVTDEKLGLVLPGGQVERGEDIFSASLREFNEETGYLLSNPVSFRRLTILPSYLNAETFCLVGKCLKTSKANKIDREIDSVELLTISEVKKMMANGEIDDARTVGFLSLYFGEY